MKIKKPSDILAEPDMSSFKLAVQQLDRASKFHMSKVKKKNVQTYQIVESMGIVMKCYEIVIQMHLAYMDKVNTYKENCRRMDEK